jgi:hypothetical protein
MDAASAGQRMTPVMFIEGKLLLPGFPHPLERRRPRARVHSELRVSPARYVLQVRIEAAPTDVGANRAFIARCERRHSALSPSSRILKGACNWCKIRNPANWASPDDSPEVGIWEISIDLPQARFWIVYELANYLAIAQREEKSNAPHWQDVTRELAITNPLGASAQG